MYKLGRFAVISLFWISAAGCTVNYIAVPRPDLSQAVLTFDDEFEGAALDLSKWNIISRILYSNGAVNAYNPAMVSVVNGHLKIDLHRLSYLGKPYSGGEVDTRNKFNQRYGYFEARIQVPSGSGLHSSWWLWPITDLWPPEIDIMEVRGSQPTQVNMTTHWSENDVHPTGPTDTTFTGDHYAESTYKGSDFTQDFHVFGVEWTPSMLIWYIDGVERHRTTEHVPQEAFWLELDLALDNYGGRVDASTLLPASMLVDYVRVYRMPNDPSIASPPATTPPGN
jgi:beta-glucanase (GH16 family)